MRFLPLALLLVASSPALATSGHETSTYFVRFHFTASAFGKGVAAVYAHAGVRTIPPHSWQDRSEIWKYVRHVEMKRFGDHFFAKAPLTGGGGSDGEVDLGPVVQYWVYFEDGSELITEAVPVPVTRRARWIEGDTSPKNQAERERGAVMGRDCEAALDGGTTNAEAVTVVRIG